MNCCGRKDFNVVVKDDARHSRCLHCGRTIIGTVDSFDTVFGTINRKSKLLCSGYAVMRIGSSGGTV